MPARFIWRGTDEPGTDGYCRQRATSPRCRSWTSTARCGSRARSRSMQTAQSVKRATLRLGRTIVVRYRFGEPAQAALFVDGTRAVLTRFARRAARSDWPRDSTIAASDVLIASRWSPSTRRGTDRDRRLSSRRRLRLRTEPRACAPSRPINRGTRSVASDVRSRERGEVHDAPDKNRTCARGLGNRCSIH